MAAQRKSPSDQTPVALLKHEIGQYVGARMKHLARKAGERLTEATDRLAEEGDGTLPKIGSRVLHGESPMKALAGEKAGEATGKVTGKIKEAIPGMGGDGDGGGGGGSGGDQSGDTKATNIVETIDVGVPLRFAYDHWTEYENFSGFTKGVQEAGRGEDASSEWTVKVGLSTRKWTATVQEQLPDDRIVWTSEGSQGTTQGAVSFHEITPTLTRIILVVVYYPSGVVEKTGNLWRAQGRRIRLDFKNFQRYVTFAEEPAEGWRGEIRDGQVVRTHEEALADEDEDEGEEDSEDSEDDEDEEEEEEEYLEESA